jgi:hypothetical protein
MDNFRPRLVFSSDLSVSGPRLQIVSLEGDVEREGAPVFCHPFGLGLFATRPRVPVKAMESVKELPLDGTTGDPGTIDAYVSLDNSGPRHGRP